MNINKAILSTLATGLLLIGCGNSSDDSSTITTSETSAALTQTQKVVALLDSFNTGAQEPISYINPNKYIQHNLSVADGLAGFGAVMASVPKGGFSAEVIRSFSDGDYVFTHTKYDFFGPKDGFDIFRFENGLIVEHWDNLSAITEPNPSGHTQFDGETKVTDTDKTATNKALVSNFLNDVLVNGKSDMITTYISETEYIQHNSNIGDGISGLTSALQSFAKNNMTMSYSKVHKVLGEGNFVLSVSEGKFGANGGVDTSFYDLFRIDNGKIVEHWDVIETILPESEWKNTNGKFGFTNE